ncbi:MAG: aminoglycoside phosphotransferase family protein [Dehalococcoidia bacterium]|nr:MAG: aminoglycoside phosphotransferase family protein [Dehalococcoidia bacterium]
MAEALGPDQSGYPPLVDIAEVDQFLRTHLGDGVTDVQSLRDGAWSRAFSFRISGQARVARFSATADDFEKDRVAAKYASADLPIPRIFDISRAPGGFCAVSERAFGDSLDDLDGERMRRVLPSLFATLDAARAVDLSTASGYGWWDASGNAPHATWAAALLATADPANATKIPGWRAALDQSPTGSAAFVETYARLEQLVEMVPNTRYLVHSDMLNHNVLVEGDHVSAVLDWGNAMAGDFLYDIALIDFWSPWYSAWNGISIQQEAARHYAAIGLDVPRYAERIRCYQVHIGLDHLAYNAFMGRWDELDRVARHTLAVVRD